MGSKDGRERPEGAVLRRAAATDVAVLVDLGLRHLFEHYATRAFLDEGRQVLDRALSQAS